MSIRTAAREALRGYFSQFQPFQPLGKINEFGQRFAAVTMIRTQIWNWLF
jgi:hypothetical protein